MSQFFARHDMFKSESSVNGTMFAVTSKTMECTDLNASSIFHAQRTLKDLIVSVRLDAGDGQVSQDHIQVSLGKKFGELPSASHSSLNFGGWYTDPVGGTRITSDTIVTYDMQVLYAHYISQSYSVDLNGQWFKDNGTGVDPKGNSYALQYTTNPDTSLYDGTYVSYGNWHIGNGYSVMRINLVGYDEFTLYLRSYAESNYDYAIAGNIDQAITSGTLSTYKARTYGNQQGGTAIGSYTKVTYTGIGGGNHFINVCYRKDSSVDSNQDRGYVLIPKL